MTAQQVAIGIDVGGTKLAGAVVDRQGRRANMRVVPTPTGTTDEVVGAVQGLIKQLLGDAVGQGEPVGIGLAVAGTIDWSEGVVVQSPNLPFSNVRLREIIEAEFGLATFMDNDGNLATLGEKHYGAAAASQHVIGLTLGTGIGSGIICGGCLYRGATGSAAEIGHMVIEATGPQCTCGSYGCFEEMASGRALVRRAKEMVALEPRSLILELAGGESAAIIGSMVTEAARKGDAVALAAFAETGFWLGVGLNNVVNIFNPEMVVLGGGVASAGELILAPALRVVKERTLHPNQDVVRIVLGKLGNQAGVFGAAALVFDEVAP